MEINALLKPLVLVSCFVPMLFSPMSLADQASSYYGLSLGSVRYERDELTNAINLSAFSGRLGKYFNEYFAFEGRLGFGNDSKSADRSGRSVDVTFDNFVGLYGKFHPAWMEQVGPYGLVGFSRVEATEKDRIFFPIPYDATGMTVGFGVDFFVSEYIAVNAEWVQLVDKGGFSAHTLQAGFVTFY